MKRFIIILMLFLFMALPVQGKEYTSTVGENWLITGADLSNCTGLTGNTWIETLIRLPGDLFYVDSNATGEADGTSWTDAVTTINAAVALCANDNGDLINVAPGHTETLGASADGVDITKSGVTLVAWGVGENAALMDYDTNTDEFVFGADDIKVINFNFKANTPDVAHAIDIEAGVENYSLIDCRFYVETTGTDEFTDTIISNAGCDNGKIINCDIEMGAGNAASAINTAGTDYLLIKNCRINGDYSVANIEDATTASIWITIQDNILVNGTVGGTAGLNTLPVITLKADTSAVIVNNTCITNVATSDLAIVAADGYLAGNTYNETEGGLANAAPVGLIAGRTYAAKATTTTAFAEDLFVVAGGPISITKFWGLVTGNIQGDGGNMYVWCNATTAAQDTIFTTTVAVEGDAAGTRWVFDGADGQSVLNPEEGAAAGGESTMGAWFCPIGTIAQFNSDTDATGTIEWYMTYIPLVEGITVTPQ